jgi:hypothetical protein
MKKNKKSKFYNALVNVLTRSGEKINVKTGVFKGYAGHNFLIDTGHGLYEHHVLGPSEVGGSLVLPYSVKIRLNNNQPEARKGANRAEYYENSAEDDHILKYGWEEQVLNPSGAGGYGEELSFAVAEDFYL